MVKTYLASRGVINAKWIISINFKKSDFFLATTNELKINNSVQYVQRIPHKEHVLYGKMTRLIFVLHVLKKN